MSRIYFMEVRNIVLIVYSIFSYTTNAQLIESGSAAGIDHSMIMLNQLGGGVAFVDINNDGLDDIYFTGGLVTDKLYLNNGNGTFCDHSDASGITDFTYYAISQGVSAGDINNDGWKDLLVSTAHGRENLLLLNNKDGSFENISYGAGIREDVWSTGAGFIDVNLDGYLDIYVINYVKTPKVIYEDNDPLKPIVGFDHECYPNFLFINNRDNSFTEQSELYKVDDIGCALGLAFIDFDLDGDQDIYVTNDFGEWVSPNALYRNEYPKQEFTEVATSTGADIEIYSMGTSVGDIDSNGFLDIYVTNIGSNALLLYEPNSFVEEAHHYEVEVDTTEYGKNITSWGSLLFDIDNDTDLDLFVANGPIGAADFLNLSEIDPDILFINDSTGFRVDSESESKLSDNRSRGAAFSDYDNDGDLDFAVVSLATSEEYATVNSIQNQLFNNQNSQDNSWLKIDLVGTSINKDAYGARVLIYAESNIYLRESAGFGTYSSQNTDLLHFGLGSTKEIDSLVIYWKMDDRLLIRNVPLNQTLRFVQGSDTYSILGCKDSRANNFNETAEVSWGCTYSYSKNSCEDPVLGINKPVIDIYPVPAEDYLFISGISNFDLKSISLTTVSGRFIELENVASVSRNELSIDVSLLKPGIYILRINAIGSSALVRTIIVN